MELGMAGDSLGVALGEFGRRPNFSHPMGKLFPPHGGALRAATDGPLRDPRDFFRLGSHSSGREDLRRMPSVEFITRATGSRILPGFSVGPPSHPPAVGLAKIPRKTPNNFNYSYYCTFPCLSICLSKITTGDG